MPRTAAAILFEASKRFKDLSWWILGPEFLQESELWAAMETKFATSHTLSRTVRRSCSFWWEQEHTGTIMTIWVLPPKSYPRHLRTTLNLGSFDVCGVLRTVIVAASCPASIGACQLPAKFATTGSCLQSPFKSPHTYLKISTQSGIAVWLF